jgi:hypothetical protein
MCVSDKFQRHRYPQSNFFWLVPGLRIRINFIRIQIHHFRLNTNPDPDPDPIRIQGFNDQKLKKITAEKKNFFFDQKLQFTGTYP